MTDINQEHQIIELRSQGLSFDKISKKVKLAKNTVLKIAKKHYVEIQNMQEMRLDSLRKQLELREEDKYRRLAEMLGVIRTELAKRDLSDVATDKLMQIYLKTLDAIDFKDQSDFLSSEMFFDPADNKVWAV